MIEAEYARSVRLLLLVTGRDRLLAGHPTLERSIDLRNPYVDALSAVQVELLGRLRQPGLAPADEAALRNVIGVTINGIAAASRTRGKAAAGSGIVGACAGSRRPSSNGRAPSARSRRCGSTTRDRARSSCG